MKKFFSFILIAGLMSFFALFSMFIAEKTDVMQLNGRALGVSFSQEGDGQGSAPPVRLVKQYTHIAPITFRLRN